MFKKPAAPVSVCFPIKDQADLTLVLIKAVDQGFLQGASPVDQSLVKTIISELGSNIIKYAKRGTLTLQRMELAGVIDVYIEAKDHGPGIPDIALAMTDRYSTGTSLGLGLPGVKRMSDEFSVSSSPDYGTHIKVRKRIGRQHRVDSAMDRISASISEKQRAHDGQNQAPIKGSAIPIYDVGYYARPVPGEIVSGDVATIIETERQVLLALIDASGHGLRANKLAQQIDAYIRAHADRDIVSLLSELHEELRGTVGAAVALLSIDLETGTASFCAVGNTGAARVAGQSWRPISKDGVLGNRLPTLSEQSVPLKNGDAILLWTDGVSELAARTYASKNAHRSSARIAKDLITALGRPFDDSSCIVFKWVA